MSNQYEVRVDGERRFSSSELFFAREMFWLLADDSEGCPVELVGPCGVIDFIDEADQ